MYYTTQNCWRNEKSHLVFTRSDKTFFDVIDFESWLKKNMKVGT